MDYLLLWNELERIITDFRGRNVQIPTEIMSDLKAAKTLITILQNDREQTDTKQRVEDYICKVENYIISDGPKYFDPNIMMKYLDAVDKAKRGTTEETERPCSHIMRKNNWIRVKPSIDLPLLTLKNLANELTLQSQVDERGNVTIIGKEEKIKEFVKKIASRYSKKEGTER